LGLKDNARLIGKLVVEFLLVIVKLFRLVLRHRRYERISIKDRHLCSNGMNSPLISASLVRHVQSPVLSPITHGSSSSSPSSLSPLASSLTRSEFHSELKDLALQQILSSIDRFLFYRTDYTDSRTMLNGCTGKCVRLSRPLFGFRTHFKS